MWTTRSCSRKAARGGRGNAFYKSAINRAPRRADPGEPGEERWLWLRLKLLADAGLVGLPNAGKSTLVATVSGARPKIADYPFTTLHPHLGVVRRGDEECVLADIPGLISGAHEGAGIGHRFLGHVERCGLLVHLVDGTQEDVADAYRTVRTELAAYGHGLDDRREIAVLGKCDVLDPGAIARKSAALAAASGTEVHPISAVSGYGIDALLGNLLRAVRAWRQGSEERDAGRRGMVAVTTRLGMARRVVIKIGSSLLVDPEGGVLRRSWLEALAEDVARLRGPRPGRAHRVVGVHRAGPAATSAPGPRPQA